jgi:hypothetical protein
LIHVHVGHVWGFYQNEFEQSKTADGKSSLWTVGVFQVRADEGLD